MNSRENYFLPHGALQKMQMEGKGLSEDMVMRPREAPSPSQHQHTMEEAWLPLALPLDQSADCLISTAKRALWLVSNCYLRWQWGCCARLCVWGRPCPDRTCCLLQPWQLVKLAHERLFSFRPHGKMFQETGDESRAQNNGKPMK